jgi:hypothetical protein
MKGKTVLEKHFNFFPIPMEEMLHNEIQSLCNFSFMKIVIIEPANKVQSFFREEMPLVPLKHHLSHLSLH